MTTRQFINREFGLDNDKPKSFASVYKDRKGNIYSYGRHYPLLFTVGGKVFRNVTGYSNSTAKHINWTRDIDAIDVCVSGCSLYTWNNPENSAKVPYLLNLVANYRDDQLEHQGQLLKAVIDDLRAEIENIKERMQAKKRHDTLIYKGLQVELANAENNYRRAIA